MTEPFVRPDVRQLLDFLDSLPGPKSHELGPEGARQVMIQGRYALDAPARGEVVVKIEAVGVCHSDLSATNGTIALPLPLILGHFNRYLMAP